MLIKCNNNEYNLIKSGRLSYDDSAIVLFIYSELSHELRKNDLYLNEKTTQTNMRFMLFLFVQHCFYMNSSAKFHEVFNDFIRKKYHSGGTDFRCFLDILNSLLGYESIYVYKELYNNQNILDEKNKKIINELRKFLQKPVSKKIFTMLLDEKIKDQLVNLFKGSNKTNLFNYEAQEITYKKLVCFYLRMHCK